MKIIKVKRCLKAGLVKEIFDVLNRGGVIIFPTETVYGLGGDSLNKKVIKKIYKIKGRKFKKPLPLISASINQVKKFFFLDSKNLELAKKYWPGPLTLVLKKKDNLPKELASDSGKVAVRVSESPLARQLAKIMARPIIATSANLAGKKECYTIDDVLKQIGEKKIDLALDGGKLLRRKPSTVVEIVDGEIKILRKGGVRL